MKNKEQTKQKLIQAVGEIVKKDGFAALKISKVAKKAEVDRKLIYRYFGGLNSLIEAYVVENDYWMVFSEKMKELVSNVDSSDSKNLIISILQNQFQYFFSEEEMQSLILWEISEENPLMRSIHNVRESMGQQFLELTDLHFNESNVNFRAVAALLVGGIYYTVLHARYNGGIICDVDINTSEGQSQILTALEQIVGWAYQEAEK